MASTKKSFIFTRTKTFMNLYQMTSSSFGSLHSHLTFTFRQKTILFLYATCMKLKSESKRLFWKNILLKSCIQRINKSFWTQSNATKCFRTSIQLKMINKDNNNYWSKIIYSWENSSSNKLILSTKNPMNGSINLRTIKMTNRSL